MKRFIPLLLVLILPSAKAQVANPSVRYVTVAPSGVCTASPPIQVVKTTGTVYTCNNGTWSAVGSGGTTVTAAAPYISLGGTKYVAQTMWPYTAMFSGAFLDANTSTITTGANGSTLFSYASTLNSFYGVAATASIESEVQVMDTQNVAGATATGVNPAIGGIWIWDSTNSKIYTLRIYIMSATGFNGNEKYYVGAGQAWTYAGSGSPATTGTVDTVSMLGAAVPHLKLSVSAGTLTEAISMDGGQTFVTLKTISSIGTISKAGIFLGNEPTAVDVLSVVVI